jgi:hypothetical protein
MRLKAEVCAWVALNLSRVLQSLTRPAVGILKYLLTFEPVDFGEGVFLENDVLSFLRVCAC